MSLARRHFQRVTAAAASAAAAPGEPINASAYELQLMQLAEDKRRLKEIQSIERKVEVKRQLLPNYAPWIEGVLEGGRGGQDAVLMTMLVWRIDTGDYMGALRIAEYALAHDLALPDQYQRDLPTLLAEEIADQGTAAMAAGKPFDYQVLVITERMTAARDMPDEVRAKLHKALGIAYTGQAGEAPYVGLARGYAEVALEHLRRARQLNERVGVKKDVERLERALRNSPPPASAPAGETSNAAEIGASDDAGTGQSDAPAPATQT